MTVLRTYRKTIVTAVAALSLTAIAAAPAVAQQPQNSLKLPLLGSVAGGGSFAGTFSLNRFAVQNNQVTALGTLTGILTNAAGVPTTVMTPVSIPVSIGQTPIAGAAVTAAQTVTAAQAAGSCDILNLVLGPLHLDLLGLVVDLNQVMLDITAQQGAGNLLGNLLCAVTGLLDSPGGLSRLLNQILGVLQGL
jgi:hypothetical protein